MAMNSVAGRVAGPVHGRKLLIVHVAGPPRRGGQAEIYRGVADTGIAVAVKIALDGRDERRGLIAEREALRAIQARQRGCDRWLVPLLDEGELPDGRPFLVLPWFEHSLQSWLHERQPGLLQRLEALERTAEAVVHLHRSSASLAGVVLHRDIKPGNLLVEERVDGLRVLLADLGGVKERKLLDATRNTGIHTPHFAPLEQMLPIDRQADPSVDVHALAVVIYAVLVGRPPQVVMSRTGLLTHAAEQLILLHQAGGGRNASDRERYAALRRAPLEQLIELDHAVALPDDDVARLRQGLANLLSDRGAQADELADALIGMLAPVLRHALEPNPRNRLSRPEVLLAALEAATERLGGRPSVAVVEEVATAAVAQDVPPSSAPSISSSTPATYSRMWRSALAAAVVLVVSCFGLFGLLWLDSSPAPGEGAAAAPQEQEAASGGPTPATVQAVPTAPLEARAESGNTRATAVVTDGDRRSRSPTQIVDVPTRSTVVSQKPSDLEQAEQPAPTPDPLVIVFSVEGDGWATGTVDGSALGALLRRDDLGKGKYAVVLNANIASEPRTFDLVLTPKDNETWEVALRDAKDKADSPVTKREGQKVIVRWAKDGRLRIDAARSSDP